jgi:phosphoribosylamine---glycine ligase
MNILLIGSGGREHALAWKIVQSSLCKKLFIAPGNPGTAKLGENVALDVNNHLHIIDFCKKNAIGLVVIGPEMPLVGGLVDDLTAQGIKAFGPTKAAARLEGSKGFTKEICAEYNIPTAAFRRFNIKENALAYIEQQGTPIVVKADGLAAGKGVVVATSLKEAREAVEHMFSGGFGDAGAQIVIEECLNGPESSFFALCDGTTALPFGTARDYKRAHDGDRGPNTGGMGAISPSPYLTPELEARVMDEIIQPTLQAMKDRGTPYTGILYAGLMLTEQGPKLIEYNCRFGDPETQVLMPRYTGDLVEAFMAAIERRLSTLAPPSWSKDPAITVVMASQGYPGSCKTGVVIRNPDHVHVHDALVFHAGTRLEKEEYVTSGGRVLAVTATGETARQAAYDAVSLVEWVGAEFRSDIGYDL